MAVAEMAELVVLVAVHSAVAPVDMPEPVVEPAAAVVEAHMAAAP